jgi:hypothetical protein
VGVQLTAKFTNKLSALVQVVSHNNYDNSFTPTLEWANISYAFTPDVNLRVGRIELPTFLASDYREVGYANPWVRVPPELYDVVPITNSDGVDGSYRSHLGPVTNTLHLIYGKSTFHAVPGPICVEGTGIFGAFDTVEYRALTTHFGYLRASVSVPFASGLPVAVYSAAASLDMARWFVQAEVARATVDGVQPIDLADDAANRASFYRIVCGKSPAQLRAYWSKLIFTGSGQPPREVADAAAMKRLVAAGATAIGYIDRSQLDPTVKAVLALH